MESDSTFVTGNGSHGIEALGSNSDVTLYQSQLKDNGGDGIRLTGSDSDLEAELFNERQNAAEAESSANERVGHLERALERQVETGAEVAAELELGEDQLGDVVRELADARDRSHRDRLVEREQRPRERLA